MTGRSGEVVHIMARKNLQVLCVQETKWRGSKAREIGGGYNLYYHGEGGTKNGVGIVLCEELKDRVLAVEGPSDRVMRITLEIEGDVWNIISCYAPQTGCTEYEKDQFWETIDSEMQAVKRSERLVVEGDLNGHVGSDMIGYEEVHGGHGVGAPNEDGIKVLDFATAYRIRILNTSYQKRNNHLVTYSSGGRESQIDNIMLRKEHANECRNCKVLPSEAITTQHRILFADLVVKKTGQQRAAGRRRIRWWKLKDEESKEKFRRDLVERLSNIDEATTENAEQWWEEILSKLRNVGRNYVEGQRERRKQGWKAGGEMIRRRAGLGRRKND